MKASKSLTLILIAGFLTAWSPQAYGETKRDPEISFSVVFNCGPNTDNGQCLTESFRPGLSVVTVTGKSPYCEAKTANSFTYKHHVEDFEATNLLWSKECSAALLEEQFRIAAVGVDTSSIRLVEPEKNGWSLSREIESKARECARSPATEQCDSGRRQLHKYVAVSPPKVYKVGNIAVLMFKYTEENFNEDGPPVLVVNNKAFRLCGSCPRKPSFFSVKKTLYLAYWATVSCCGCGDLRFFVYDLSRESPKLVYDNYYFSN